jgi:hypothetical protein
MKDTIQKDKRRKESFQIKADYQECWAISLKYSSILVKNIKSDNLLLSCTVYGQYLHELQYKNLNVKDKNYVQIWETMINTISKDYIKGIAAIRLLHQTNVQKNN